MALFGLWLCFDMKDYTVHIVLHLLCGKFHSMPGRSLIIYNGSQECIKHDLFCHPLWRLDIEVVFVCLFVSMSLLIALQWTPLHKPFCEHEQYHECEDKLPKVELLGWIAYTLIVIAMLSFKNGAIDNAPLMEGGMGSYAEITHFIQAGYLVVSVNNYKNNCQWPFSC